VDFDTLKDSTVTIRDLDTMKQLRMPISHLGANITHLASGLKTWEDVSKEYPAFESSAKDQE
jgi:glycyl-tRNA synthetase